MLYLDNNATTRPCDEAVAACQRAAATAWANPSSVHRAGQDARHAVELARNAVARLIGASPKHLTFTSGGTESLDLAIRGVLATTDRRVVVTTAVEHHAVRGLLESLEQHGRIERRFLPIDAAGVVRPDAIERVIDDSVALACVQWANNETGVIQPVGAIGARSREVGAIFACDGVQWVGKMPVDLGHNGDGGGWCDLLALSAHKWHGIKGCGALWVRPGVALRPQLIGTQEHERRGGTENVPGILAAGAAADAARVFLADTAAREQLAALRDRFEHAVCEAVPGAVINSAHATRLWNTTNIAFPKLEAEALLLAFSERGLCASAGAACSSGSLEPSPVLLAMGVPPELAHGSVRFSLSRYTTKAEVDQAAAVVTACAQRVARSMT